MVKSTKKMKALLKLWYLLPWMLLIKPCIGTCPKGCDCKYLYEIVACNSANLSQLPEGISSEVKLLEFANNSFEAIPYTLSLYKQLEFLNLSRNRIPALYEDSLHGLTELRGLDLSYNLLSWNFIHYNALVSSSNLERLDLSNNVLLNANNQSLKSNSMKILKLVNCSILNISGHLLSAMPNLTTVDVTYNKISSVGHLPHMNKLQILIINQNIVEDIVPEAVVNLTSLKMMDVSRNHRLRTLNFSSNSLEELYAHICCLDYVYLDNIPNLTKVILHGNRLRQVPMMNLSLLKYLDLANNTLTFLHKNTFRKLESLENLILSYNTITTVHYSVFNANFRLIKLDLSNNYFNGVTKFDIESLRALDMSNCEINVIRQDSLKNMPSLETLNLAKNPLSKIPNNLTALNLISLDFTLCRIVTINNWTFYAMPRLEKLYLVGNRLTDIKANYFYNVKKISLEDNAWRCQCISEDFHNLYDWLRSLGHNTRQLICQFPENVEGMQWDAACYNDWFKGISRSKSIMYSLVVLVASVLLVCIFLSAKRACRIKEERERQQMEAEQRVLEEIMHRERREMEMRLVPQNAPDPRELQGPPSYNEALLLPRLDGSYSNLAGSRHSLNGSRRSLNNTGRKDTRQKVRRKKRRVRAASESPRENAHSDTDSDPPMRRLYMESNI